MAIFTRLLCVKFISFTSRRFFHYIQFCCFAWCILNLLCDHSFVFCIRVQFSLLMFALTIHDPLITMHSSMSRNAERYQKVTVIKLLESLILNNIELSLKWPEKLGNNLQFGNMNMLDGGRTIFPRTIRPRKKKLKKANVT